MPLSTGPYDLFKSSWEDLKDRPRNKGISLTFSMPLWDSGVNRAEVAAAQARIDQAELDLENESITVQREIKDVVSRVLEARNRLEVLEKAKMSLNAATKSVWRASTMAISPPRSRPRSRPPDTSLQHLSRCLHRLSSGCCRPETQNPV